MPLTKLPTTTAIVVFALILAVMYNGYSIKIQAGPDRLLHLEKSEQGDRELR